MKILIVDDEEPIRRFCERALRRAGHETASCEDADAAARRLARRRESSGLAPVRMGFGINSGAAVAGCLGTRERAEYTVIGHAVNLAQRLEEAARPGQILLGPATVHLMGEGFVSIPAGMMRLEGLAEPIAAFELMGVDVKPDLSRS